MQSRPGVGPEVGPGDKGLSLLPGSLTPSDALPLPSRPGMDCLFCARIRLVGDETQEKGQNGSPFLAAGGAGKGEWGRLRVLFGPFVKKKKKKS